MQKLYLLLILLTPYYLSFSQVGIVNAGNGYINVRNAPSVKSPVTDTLQNGFIIYSIDAEHGWLLVDYYKNGQYLTGNIHQSGITFLNSFKPFAKKIINDSTICLQYNDTIITITTGVFKKQSNTVQYENNSKDIIKSVNGKTVYGTGG